jgi:hypothetical protein
MGRGERRDGWWCGVGFYDRHTTLPSILTNAIGVNPLP